MDNQMNNNPLVQVRLHPEQHPRLRTMNRENASMLLMDILSKAYLYKGYRLDEDNIKFMAAALIDEMLLDNHKVGMPNISMYEIGYAIKKAVMDNEDFFFSVSYLYNVIKKFCLGDGHQAMIEANKIVRQLKNSSPALEAMTDTYAGKMLMNSRIK